MTTFNYFYTQLLAKLPICVSKNLDIQLDIIQLRFYDILLQDDIPKYLLMQNFNSFLSPFKHRKSFNFNVLPFLNLKSEIKIFPIHSLKSKRRIPFYKNWISTKEIKKWLEPTLDNVKIEKLKRLIHSKEIKALSSLTSINTSPNL